MPTQRIVLAASTLAALVVTSACGTSAVSSPTSSAAAAPQASPNGSPPAAAPALAGDWQGFRGDPSHTGIAAAGPVGHPVLNWQYHARSAVPHAISVIGDQVSFASDDGSVYALDRATGKERWVVSAGTGPIIGPWAADGRLYVVNGAGHALALDAGTGKTLWTSSASYSNPTELVAADGRLYFGTSEARIVAVDGATGAESWSVKPSEATAWVGNPAVSNGRVYAGTSTGFVALDIATHKIAWTGDTHGQQTGSASVNEGLAFIAAGGDGPDTPARAFDAATGELRWTADEGLTFPVAADGMAFSSTMDGLVDGLDLTTGAVRWSMQLSGAIRPLVVANHVLYIAADTEQHIDAVDTVTGAKLWQFDVDASNDCCIAVAGGTVYAATLAGTVYAIGGDGSTTVAQPPASVAQPPASVAPTPARATPSPATQAPIAAIATSVAWSADLRGMSFSPVCQIAADPTTGLIWAPEANGGKIAIFSPSGKLVDEWGQPGEKPGQFAFARANGDGYGTLAFAQDGSFYVLDVGNLRVQQFDAKRRFVRAWGAPGRASGQYADPVGIAVAPDGTVWVLDDRRSVVEHYTADGEVLGGFDPFKTQPVNNGANSLAIDRAGNLYVSGAGPNVVWVFDSTGALLRVVGKDVFAEQAGNMAIDSAGRLFISQGPDRHDEPGVLLFGPDGTLVGGFGPEGEGDGQLIFPGGIALDGKGGVYVEDSLPESARLIRFELPATLR